MEFASANAANGFEHSEVASSLPTMIRGFSAEFSNGTTSSIASTEGAGSPTETAFPGAAEVWVVSTSSGRATTTGPGRPDMAVVNARLMISGILSADSIWVAHFTSGPKNAR